MESNKALIRQTFEGRIADETDYLDLLTKYLFELKAQALTGLEGAKLAIEIYELERNIKSKKYFIDKLNEDLENQLKGIDDKMQAVQSSSAEVLDKAKKAINNKVRNADTIKALLKEQPQENTDEWYMWIIKIAQTTALNNPIYKA
jgi:predicted phage tail protein